jgi:hypothetical protein
VLNDYGVLYDNGLSNDYGVLSDYGVSGDYGVLGECVGCLWCVRVIMMYWVRMIMA